MDELSDKSVRGFTDTGFNPVLGEGLRAGTTSAQALTEEEEADLKAILKTPHGRRFVWRVLAEARLFQTTYSLPYAGAELQMAFLEGRKQFGYRLFQDVQRVAPKAWDLMVKEQKNG